MKKRSKIKIVVWVIVAALSISLLTAAGLLYFGVVHLNNPSEKDYPVRGVDLSSYQGSVDWNTLSAQNIRFAFIKATEGSSFVDPRFKDNWSAAAGTGLRIGAYHFFSFESPGETQAELFRSTVKEVKKELRTLVDILTDEYDMKPIIYANGSTYKTIVRGDFDDCDLWFRSVYSGVPSDISWTFWQYSNRHRLEGYSGRERYIDMNIFNGDAGAFAAYPGKEE